MTVFDLICRVSGEHSPHLVTGAETGGPRVWACLRCGVLLWEEEMEPLAQVGAVFRGPYHPVAARKINAAMARSRAWKRYGRQAPEPPP